MSVRPRWAAILAAAAASVSALDDEDMMKLDDPEVNREGRRDVKCQERSNRSDRFMRGR